MSRHSKNNTSSSVFTYAQKQKLKGVYGTKKERISQDSIKTFSMCTLCSNRLIEPTCCDKGHMFCRECIIQYLVKQKKIISQHNEECQQQKRKIEMEEQDKQLQKKMEQIDKYEKYDNFLDVTERKKLAEGKPEKSSQVQPSAAKPTGIYEINSDKEKYLKTSFWTIQNTPKYESQKEKKDQVVLCPGSQHKLTRKKLRDIKCKQIEGQFNCHICNKEVGRQKVGAYKCGHLVCYLCKSEQCQVCSQKEGWIDIQGSSSSFAMHQKSQVTTYTYAFYS